MGKILGFALWILRLPFKKGEMGGRGQVAIFAALIFQVLFVFFAMVVNVGLLVHHKINLQNSVDLAAYYGAMKQAEVLDAIAHANYQIRQSWKLLAFRYRGYGMAGNNQPDTPYMPPVTGGTNPNDFGHLGTTANQDQEYRSGNCPASFCNSYMTWNMMDKNENYCKDPCTGQSITLPGQPYGASALGGLTLGGLGTLANQINQLSQEARSKIKNTCQRATAVNWFTLARFIFGYKIDVANRKKVINLLANGISSDVNDLQDIDGQSVKAGVLQTLIKNLTYENQASIGSPGGSTGSAAGGFTFFNSLAAGGCGGTAGDQGTPPKWLAEIFAKPLYAYMDGDCADSDETMAAVKFKIRLLNAMGTPDQPTYGSFLDPSLIKYLLAYIDDPVTLDTEEARLYHTTIGYEKNPWCMAYVKVSATTTPKIPFSPFAPPKLTATAYAKPFGGRIGPWFYKSWPASSPESTGGPSDQVDTVLPPRVRPGEQTVEANNNFLHVDYSRYVGDLVGSKSTLTTARYSQALFTRQPAFSDQIDITWWDHLLDSTGANLDAISNDGDVLAWDKNNDRAPPVRTLEVAAVIPDQFDITHFSIEPNWWRTYAQRIQKRSDFSNLNVRGDIGFRKDGNTPWNHFSIRDQMEMALPDNTFDFENTLTYVAGLGHDPKTAFGEVLTSWHTKVPGNYILDPARFGKCAEGGDIQGEPTDVDRSVPGDCMVGGHTGYAVKIVDESAITSVQEIGGAGNTGQIKNLPTGQ